MAIHTRSVAGWGRPGLAAWYGVVALWFAVVPSTAAAPTPVPPAVEEEGAPTTVESAAPRRSSEEVIRDAKAALAAAPGRAEEASLRYDLGGALAQTGRQEEAGEELRKAVDVATELGDRRLLLRCQQRLGTVYKDQGRFDLALEAFHAALELAPSAGGPGAEVALLLKIGNVLSRSGDWDRALPYFERALRRAEQQQDQAQVANALNNIGIAYRNLERYDEALEYFKRALAIKERFGDRAEIAHTLNNLGAVYGRKGEHERALEHFLRSLELKRELGDRAEIASSLNNVGVAYGELGQAELGERYLTEAVSLREELGDRWGLASALNDLAGLLLEAKRPGEAMRHSERALQAAREIGAKQLELVSLQTLSRADEALGKLTEALSYQRLAQKLADTIFDERTSAALAGLRARYQLEEKDREIALLSREREAQELQIESEQVKRWASIVGALLLLAFVVVLHRAYRLKAKTSAALDVAYRRMEELARRDALSGVLSRRAMVEAIEEEQRRFGRFGRKFAIVMADVDRFKEVNDRHGHHAGDAVLVGIARQFISHLRGADFLGRWGGDEFLILLTETDLDGGVHLAERLREAVRANPAVVDGQPLPVTLTFGVSVHDRLVPVDTTIRAADEALYEGKAAGRDCVTSRRVSQ